MRRSFYFLALYRATMLAGILALACMPFLPFCAGQAPPMPPAPPVPSLTIPATASGDLGEFLTVKATTTQAQVRWFSPDKGLRLFPAELLKDTRTAVLTAQAPGTYRLYAIAAAGDVPLEVQCCQVTISGPPPVPTPGPNPGPTPPGPGPGPAPVGKALWVIVVKDSNAMTLEAAKVIGDQTLWADVEKAGHHWRVLEMSAAQAVQEMQQLCPNGNCPAVIPANPPARLGALNYGPYVAQAGGPPALLILDQAGKVYKAVKLPATSDGVRAALKEVAGS